MSRAVIFRDAHDEVMAICEGAKGVYGVARSVLCASLSPAVRSTKNLYIYKIDLN